MSEKIDGPKGQDLWRRADRVLPGGGIYLTRSARFAGNDVLPGFYAAAEGCRITDVDGRRYIDFNCGNGPNLLGFRHPEVEEAAARQAAVGDLMPFFSPAFVEFGERLLAWGEGFGWTVLGKNGSDVTTLAARVARTATGRDQLVLFERAYHGNCPEYALLHERSPADALQHVRRLAWNDPAALEDLARREGDGVAALMLNPLDQNPAQDTTEATPEFVAAIRAFKQRTGALVILDDVRNGFRIHPKGSHQAMGLEPDLLCLGKALANGYSTSALLGVEALREAARKIIFTATYMFSAVACRAGIATLDIYERENAFATLERAGRRLRDGFLGAAATAGHSIRYTGPVAQPTLRFEDDPRQEKLLRFARESALRGAIFHPRLNWFLCSAHDDAAIDEALAIAGEAFRATPLP